MSSISQHVSTDLISLGRTSIIYAVTDIVFSLKQNIPPSGWAVVQKYHYYLTGVMANRNMLCFISIRRRIYRSSVFGRVLALLSDSFPFTVRWVFTSASCSYSIFKEHEGTFCPSSLICDFFEFWAKKLIKNSSDYEGSSSCGSLQSSAEACEQHRIGVPSKALAQDTDDKWGHIRSLRAARGLCVDSASP